MKDFKKKNNKHKINKNLCNYKINYKNPKKRKK